LTRSALLGLVAGLLLTVGCQSTPRAHSTGSPEDVTSTNGVAEMRSRLAGITTSEKLARAHAHYATGLLHELNNEPEAALTVFYRACLYDSGNEQLVLDTTRQLMETKQPGRALDILLLAADHPDASGNIYARLGLVYIQLGDTARATEANRIAVRKSPSELAG